MLSFPVVVPVPFMTYDEYAKYTGMSKRNIGAWVEQGKIIIQNKDKPKEQPLVNIVAMTELATRETLDKLR